MTNIQWKENGKTRYENLLSENSVEDFVKNLRDKGYTDIVITNNIEKKTGVLLEYHTVEEDLEKCYSKSQSVHCGLE